MPRPVIPPEQHQAQAREAAMAALRAMPAYEGFLLSLRQRWSAAQIPPMSARFVTVRELESLQLGQIAADSYSDWGIRPSDGLRAYLGKLDEIVSRHLHLMHLAADRAPAWWVKQVLHEAAIKHIPPPYHERADVGEGEGSQPAPVVKITTEGYGVRVTLHDPATGELVPAWVFPDRATALAFIDDTLAQHEQAQKWPRNAASEATMRTKDIPKLMKWYVAGDRPPREDTRRRLRKLAREVLALDPPPTDAEAFPENRGTPSKGRRKTSGKFFVRVHEIVGDNE